MQTMKALTVRQPWAGAIVRGEKCVENRSWPTNYRGRLLIHAGAAGDGEPKRAIIGSVEVVDCVRLEPGSEAWRAHEPWVWPDHWHWLLADARQFRRPVECSGSQGLWTPPERVTLALPG
jgi:hypothetical protein